MPALRSRPLSVAIVGASAILPGSTDVSGFWRNVLEGRDLVTEVPPTHWLVSDYYDPDPAAPDRTHARRGAFLDPIEFDPLAFGIPPNTLPATDTTQLLGLLAAEHVLRDALGEDLTSLDRSKVSVVLGTSALELLTTMSQRLQRPVWLKALRESGVAEDQAQAICDRIAEHYVPWQEATFPGLLSNVVAGRIANRFDLGGANYTTDAACASSLAAIATAVNELSCGQSDLVITGGVDTLNDITMYMCFSKTQALSPQGDCRPFSDQADGTILGEGVVMFALKRLADAERDGDRVYAVIRGIGASSDGRGTAIYAPLPRGQASALRRAYQAAGYGPETVELVEAHGTGTKAGDAAEFSALHEVFTATGREDAGWCALGSVKSQIGHTKSAAGAAGLLKATLALHHKTLPPTIKVDRPNPGLDLDAGPLYVNTCSRPWVRGSDHPRRASVSSFGFGGSNFHLTLEEYLPQPDSSAQPQWLARAVPTELVLLSAASPAELVAQARDVLSDDSPLATVARRSQLTFRADDAARLAVVAVDRGDLAGKLGQAIDRIGQRPTEPVTSPTGLYYAAGVAESWRIAFLFPGQGSQYVGMGAELAMHFPAAQSAWDHHSSLRIGDRPLHQVVFPVPVFTDGDRKEQQTRLTATEWAQPALAAQSLAMLGVLSVSGVTPDVVAGHSFGELIALHAAGAFDADTLMRLARKRGELMRDASATRGAMLAVSASRSRLEEIIGDWSELWLANHNAPDQVVIAGTLDAVNVAADKLAAERITVRLLDTATAFHTPLVAPATEPLQRFLDEADVRTPTLPVYSNTDTTPYPAEPDAVRARLAGQLAKPVRFAEQIETMYRDGARIFVEVGADAKLTNLVGRIIGDREHVAVGLDSKGRHGVTSLQHAFGRLSVAGVPISFSPLWEPYAAPAEASARRGTPVEILGTNFGKMYPPADEAELPEPNPPQSLSEALPVGGVSPSTVRPEEIEYPGSELLGVVADKAAEAHIAYQRAMSESHLAFLKLFESASGGTIPEVMATPAAETAGSPTSPPPEPVSSVPIESSRVVVEASVVAGVSDVESLVLSVIAEKTGYPVEMLDAGMELEGDLGIDSIKRVEILSAVSRRFPEMARLDASEFAAVRSVGQIAAKLRDHSPVSPVPVVKAPVVAEVSDVESLVLSVIAEKTGYPVEMLDAGMELEGDLGIDSIKRVEILSAVSRRFPEMARLDASEFAAVRSVGQIAAKLCDHSPASQPGEVIPSATRAAGSAAPVTRSVVRSLPAAAPGTPLAGLADGPIAVTDDGTGIARYIAEKLVVAGIPSAVVVGDIPADAQGVLFLGALGEVDSLRDAAAVQRAALRAARSVAARFGETGGVFVTVQDTGGDFGLSGHAADRAWLGGVAALARTAAHEWPSAAVKAIDCERGGREPEVLADAIVTELLTGGTDTDVGLRADGRRHILVDVDLPSGVAATGPARVGPESVIVVTGGARGVTAAAVRALAEAHRPRLVLLGRTPVEEEPEYLTGVTEQAELTRAVIEESIRRGGERPTLAAAATVVSRVVACREIRATLEALREAGSEVRYMPVDVRDTRRLDTALAEVRETWGPVTGIVHGAGVLADKWIADKTDEQFDRVFGTKVEGLHALLAATAADPVDLLCVFSSVAARYGNAGQCDYAMANETLNHVVAAEAARRTGATMRALVWGPWRGGMVDATLAGHFHDRGVALIGQEEGAAAFVAELDGSAVDETRIVLVAEAADGPVQQPMTEVRLSSRSHPYLGDHEIAGKPVLPIAMALEWFTAAAAAGAPESPMTVLRDIRVLRRVSLDNFAAGGDRLTVRGREALELVGDGGTRHYQAVVHPGAPHAGDWPEPENLQPARGPPSTTGTCCSMAHCSKVSGACWVSPVTARRER
ncbi:type I polyketide synthase [Amycolatopsis sp. EV170708-02-1]|uniref:type I polyketide synthase n=1 Tax=Amycolatopsis sp. EV170708-02-1 TaxID=2919322 RepID=UPI001F0BEE90|nr:type I polyketide synthase [Amycolatopsis sp. EV170708-02-1]UMP06726.1 SDR family NAD(P)-dependent oxidoreductase [Amycolatopsis sp. EV170708-02-1]